MDDGLSNKRKELEKVLYLFCLLSLVLCLLISLYALIRNTSSIKYTTPAVLTETGENESMDPKVFLEDPNSIVGEDLQLLYRFRTINTVSISIMIIELIFLISKKKHIKSIPMCIILLLNIAIIVFVSVELKHYAICGSWRSLMR